MLRGKLKTLKDKLLEKPLAGAPLKAKEPKPKVEVKSKQVKKTK